MKTRLQRLAFFILFAGLAASSAQAQLLVDQNDVGCSDVTGTPYCTIQAAVNAATAGQTVSVAPGTYIENVTINKNLTLFSTSGRAVTTIQGLSSVGSLGAVVVTGGTSGVQIGGVGQGFTIVGIDNGAPGVENAAVYFQGSHSNAVVRDNEVVANGDHGLVTEFGATISGFIIDDNEFSGQTFLGAMPGGCGAFAKPSQAGLRPKLPYKKCMTTFGRGCAWRRAPICANGCMISKIWPTVFCNILAA